MTHPTITEQIQKAIAENGGSVHDALNVTLAQRDRATALLKMEQERSAVLEVRLEAINAILGIGLSPETTMRAIDKALEGHKVPLRTTKED